LRKKVLIVGLDVTLAESRAAALDNQYDVVIVEPSAALRTLRRDRFDLMLVCYTTPREQAIQIIRASHDKFPLLCIVHLRTLTQKSITLPVIHRLVTLNYHPDGWMKAVDELLLPKGIPDATTMRVI
jgi:hypothetical protein